MLRVIMALMVLGPAFPALAPQQTEDTALLRGEVAEVARESVPVSGGGIIGVVSGTLDGAPLLSRLRIALPGMRPDQLICISAITRDGLYSASGKLQAPSGRVGPSRIEALSSLTAKVAQYPATDMAVRATVGKDCDVRYDAPLVVTSYAGSTSNQILTVMVQGRGARSGSVSLTDAAGRKADGSCSQDLTKVSRAFDFVCTVPLGQLRQTGKASLQVDLRQRSGNLRTERAEILWTA